LRLKKKKRRKAKLSDYEKKLNPLIVVREDEGEALYAVADISLPGENEIRRIISKRHDFRSHIYRKSRHGQNVLFEAINYNDGERVAGEILEFG